MELYQKVSLLQDIDEYGLKKGDVATLADFIEHPGNDEKGCVLEILNALGETIDVITVPVLIQLNSRLQR
jgi:crotonobetainyl-CoA:carnitine CoA-transferase CaiB-like acyl-CoA transferase